MKKMISTIAVLGVVLTLILSSISVVSARANRGDANADGDINMKDILAIRKYMAHVDVQLDLEASDANGDKEVNMKDILIIRKYMAHMDVVFPPYDDTSDTSTTSGTKTPAKENMVYETGFVAETYRPDQITLSYYDSKAEDIGVTWTTTKKTPDAVVQIVKVTGSETPDFSKGQMVEARTDAYPNTQTMSFDHDTCEFRFENYNSVVQYAHHAVLDQLDYDTTYAYRVGDYVLGAWSDVYRFTTRKKDVTEFSFVMLSDTQYTKTAAQGGDKFFHDTLDGAFSMDPNASFIMHGGDVIQQGKYMHQWQVMLDGTKDYLTKYPIMLASGNHESTNDSAGDYVTYLHTTIDLPEPNSHLDRGIYYSFDYGPAHFIVLNSSIKAQDGIDKEQREWIDKDLSQNTKKWIIVMLHAPMISSKRNDSEYTADLFAKYGVDLVLQADEHVYMRSKPFKNNQIVTDYTTETIDGVEYYNNLDGTIYITTATGGNNSATIKSTAAYNNLVVWGDSQISCWDNIYVTEDTLTVKTYYYNNGKPTLFPQGSWGIIDRS